MTPERVSVSAICTFHWTLGQDLAFYRDAGIDRIGASVAKLERHGWDHGIRLIRESGLVVDNLIGLGPFHLATPDQWPAQRDRLTRALDAASALGASTLVLTTGPAGQLSWEDAAAALELALRSVLDDARSRGIEVAIEHTNSLRADVGFVHTLADAIDLACGLGAGVCMELNACWAERGLAETIARGLGEIRLVQVSDYAVGTLSTPNRLVPGDGDIPLERIISQLTAAGYTGTFDLELIGPRIEEEGYMSATTRAVDWLSRLLTSLEV